MKKILFAGVLCTSLFASCATEPTACFSTDKSGSVKENEEVKFNAGCSEDASSYSWNFGDGGTAEGIEAKHKYSAAGTYDVKLTATSDGQVDEATARITVVK